MRVLLFYLAAVASASGATVLLPDGSPANGALAAPLTVEYFVHVTGIGFARPVEPRRVSEAGSLEVTPETAGRWIILHSGGWADAELSAETKELRLEPWQEICGTIEVPLPPDPVVSYHRLERPFRQGECGTVMWTSTAPVDAGGAFTITHVPAGHGSVGLLRETRSERRILKWRDYPRAVVVPQSDPLRLGGGGTVSGRIVSGALPAVVTLSSRSADPGYNTLTEDDGRFAIPGVLPGVYWLSARPNLGHATRNIPQRMVGLGTEPLDLGNLSGGDDDVEIDHRLEMFEDLIDRVRAKAVRQVSVPIEKIWIGELGRPSGRYGARVTFTPRPEADDPTRATQVSLLLDIPGETIRKFYPEHDLLGWGFRFSDAPFGEARTFEQPLRVFPLQSRSLYLRLDEGMSYEDTLALLRAIEARTIKHPESERGKNENGKWTVTVRGVGTCPPEILPQISGIRGQKDGTIEVQTTDRPFGGGFYQFKKRPDGSFELTGGGGWVS